MTRWVIAYKNGEKWVIYCSVTSRAKIGEKIADLFKFNPKVEKIQIQKIIK